MQYKENTEERMFKVMNVKGDKIKLVIFQSKVLTSVAVEETISSCPLQTKYYGLVTLTKATRGITI